MHIHALQALANPVYDPTTQLAAAPGWRPERGFSAKLSCNIGME